MAATDADDLEVSDPRFTDPLVAGVGAVLESKPQIDKAKGLD